MSSQTHAPDAFSTEHLHADLRKHSVRGGALTLTSQGTQFVLSTVSTVVLARLLTPADFGLVAMVTAITGLAMGFADLGLSEATIQSQTVTHDQVTNLFWINAGIGLGLTLVIAGLAPVLAWFYRQPRLIGITLWSSLNFLVGGLTVQHGALLKRQMRFLALVIRDTASMVSGVAAGVITAWQGGGYWAIVVGPLTTNFTRMALSWLMVTWLPGLPKRRAKVGSMVVFGGNVAASYVIYNLNRSSDAVLIGWYWGAGPLGLYSRAYNLLMLPLRQVNVPATNVAVPAFSRLQNDAERFARYYLRVANLTVWITTPAIGFLFVAARPVILLVLGRQWGGAAPVFQFLAIAGLAQLLFDSTLWLFISKGESARLLKLLLVISPIIVGSFAIGLPFGIKGVALCGSLVLLGMLPWVLNYAFRGTELTLLRLAQAIVRPVSLAFAGVLCGELALHLAGPKSTIAQLLATASGFVFAYALSLLIPPIREEVMSLKQLFTELRSSSSPA